MERLFNFFSKAFLSILTFIKIIIRSSFFIKSYKTKEKSVFILGNGPSIKKDLKLHLDFLKNQNLLCVNKFPDTEYYEILKPQSFTITSKGFYNVEASDYNVEVRKKIIKALINKTQWPLRVILPADAKKNKAFIKSLKSNKNISLSYFNMTPVEGLIFINTIIYKLGLGTPRPHNVLIPSILNSINANYKEIYILGADHSWLPQITVNDQNEVLLNQQHFYDENTSKARQMHKNEGKGNRTLDEVLHKFMLSFRSYHELERYAKTKNCDIFNVTPNSFIDAFRRITIEQLIKNK